MRGVRMNVRVSLVILSLLSAYRQRQNCSIDLSDNRPPSKRLVITIFTGQQLTTESVITTT
jgi:hypothetical protein